MENDALKIKQLKDLLNWSVKLYFMYYSRVVIISEAAAQMCSQEKVFWKYAANLQENTHAEVWYQ